MSRQSNTTRAILCLSRCTGVGLNIEQCREAMRRCKNTCSIVTDAGNLKVSVLQGVGVAHLHIAGVGTPAFQTMSALRICRAGCIKCRMQWIAVVAAQQCDDVSAGVSGFKRGCADAVDAEFGVGRCINEAVFPIIEVWATSRIGWLECLCGTWP